MSELGSTLSAVDLMNAAHIAAKKRGYRHPMLAAVKQLRLKAIELNTPAALAGADFLLIVIADHEDRNMGDLP